MESGRGPPPAPGPARGRREGAPGRGAGGRGGRHQSPLARGAARRRPMRDRRGEAAPSGITTGPHGRTHRRPLLPGPFQHGSAAAGHPQGSARPAAGGRSTSSHRQASPSRTDTTRTTAQPFRHRPRPPDSHRHPHDPATGNDAAPAGTRRRGRAARTRRAPQRSRSGSVRDRATASAPPRDRATPGARHPATVPLRERATPGPHDSCGSSRPAGSAVADASGRPVQPAPGASARRNPSGASGVPSPLARTASR